MSASPGQIPDLASSGVGDDNDKFKILKYPLAKLPISNMEIPSI